MTRYWPELNTPARLLFQQAAFACASGNLAGCLQLLRDAHVEAVRSFGFTHETSLHISTYLVEQLRHQGFREEARTLARQSLELAEQSSQISYHLLLPHLIVLYELANPNDPLEIERLNQRFGPIVSRGTEETLEVPSPPDPTTAVQTLISQAIQLNGAGKHSEFAARILEAYRLGEGTLGSDHPHTLCALSELAAIDLAQGRLQLAEERRSRVLDLAMQSEGPAGHTVERTCAALASLYSFLGEYQAAEHFYRRVIAILEWRAVPGPKSFHLARCLALQNRIEDARVLFRQTVAEGCEWLPEAWINAVRHLDWWQIGYLEEGSPHDLTRILERLDQGVARALEASHLQLAVTLLDNKTALWRGLGRSREADETADQAAALRQRLRAADTSVQKHE